MRRLETGILARAAVALGIVGCLALSACGSKHTGTGNNGAVADGSAPAPEISDPSGEPSTAASGTGGGGSSGDTTSTSGVRLKVTAAIDPVVPAVVVTNNCPYAFALRATVSVNKGPVDLRYQWRGAPAPAAPQPLHFGGTGPQSKVVTVSGTAAAYDTDVGRELQVLDLDNVVILSSTRTFHLTCGVKLSAVTPRDPPAHCPYVTNFSVTITAAVSQHVTYEWHLGDGTVVPGDVLVMGSAYVVTVNNVTVTASGLTGTYHITLKVTSLGGGTATGTVQCPTVNT